MDLNFFSFPVELYNELPLKILLTLSRSHPHFAPHAIKALFGQTSQKAADYQLSLLQQWCEGSLETRSQLADDRAILSALSNFKMTDKIPGLIILARRKKINIAILSDQQFTSLLEAIQDESLSTSSALFRLIPVMSTKQITLLSYTIIKEIDNAMVQMASLGREDFELELHVALQKKVMRLASFLNPDSADYHAGILIAKLNSEQDTPITLKKTLLSTLGFLLNRMSGKNKEDCVKYFLAQPIPTDVESAALSLYLKGMSLLQRQDYVDNVMKLVNDEHSTTDNLSLLYSMQFLAEYMTEDQLGQCIDRIGKKITGKKSLLENHYSQSLHVLTSLSTSMGREQKIRSMRLINSTNEPPGLKITKLKGLSFFSDVMNSHELKVYLLNVGATSISAKAQNAIALRTILKMHHHQHAGLLDYVADQKIQLILLGTNQSSQTADLKDLSLYIPLFSAQKNQEITKKLFDLIDSTPALTSVITPVLSVFFDNLSSDARGNFITQIDFRLKNTNPQNEIISLLATITNSLTPQEERIEISYITQLIEQLGDMDLIKVKAAFSQLLFNKFIKIMTTEQKISFLENIMNSLGRLSEDSLFSATVITEITNLHSDTEAPAFMECFEVHKKKIVSTLLACTTNDNMFVRTLVEPAHHLFSLMDASEKKLYIDNLLRHMDEDEVTHFSNIFYDYLMKAIVDGGGLDLTNPVRVLNEPATLVSNRKMLLLVLERLLISINYNITESTGDENKLWQDASDSLAKNLNEIHLNTLPEDIQLQIISSLSTRVFSNINEAEHDRPSSP